MTSTQVPTPPRDSFEEDAPLLSPIDANSYPPIQDSAPRKQRKPWVLLIVLAFFLITIIDIGAFLAEAPKTRVYEANLCVRYYQERDPSKIQPDGTVKEELCKEDAIQSKMAMIFGWQDMFDAIPGLILAVPFGILADKWGRKWIFAGTLIWPGYFRTLPLQLTWFSSAFYLVGGGPIVASAVGCTMISDIVPPEKRTSIFLYLLASTLIAELIAPILASKLMQHGDWLPLILSLAIQQIGICIAFFFPETLHLRDLPEPTDTDGSESDEIELQPVDTKHGLKAQIRYFKEAMRFLKRDAMLALVIFTFLVNRLGQQSLSMLLRYASKRYGWKIQKAAYLTSFRAATSLVALMIFIPTVNVVMVKYFRLSTHRADIWLARASIVITTLAFFIMGIAAEPALLIIGILIFNFGTGYNAAMRSIAIHVAGGQSSPDIGMLFAVIAIMESLGAMVAGPLLASTFEWGIEKGGPMIGLPFIASSLIFAVVAVVTFMISAKTKEVAYIPVEDNDNE
ncbi:MFS transporter-like protein, partial [Dendryphion nanum]